MPIWPHVSAKIVSGQRLWLSESEFFSGGALEFRVFPSPEGQFEPLEGDVLSIVAKTGQLEAPTQLSSCVLGAKPANCDYLPGVLPFPDVVADPDAYAAVFPRYDPGKDPFSPVPCRFCLTRIVDSAARLYASSALCGLVPMVAGAVPDPGGVPGVYLTVGGVLYRLVAVDEPLTGAVTTALEEVSP